MRALSILSMVLLLMGCGVRSGASDSWTVELRDSRGQSLEITSTFAVVLFRPDVEPQRVSPRHGYEPGQTSIDLPALAAGHYEVWAPGYRPLRVNQAPTGPLQLVAGYPVDVELHEDASVPQGQAIQVSARWRGPGAHPEANLRTAFHPAAPPAGVRSATWMDFVKGVLIRPPTRSTRLLVPWPGLYRLRWGVGRFAISEGRGFFNASGGSSQSPEDAVPVDVPEDGPPPRVMIPVR